MYPVFRMAKELIRNRNTEELALGDTHVCTMRVRPWDIDPFLELNNGRILTLFDLGRFGLLQRMNMPKMLRQNGWYGAVGGSVVRYRRRITVFQKLELRTRVIGWDDRFTYIEQAFWRGSECCAHAIVRIVVTSGKGIVPTADLAAAFNFPVDSPALPDWVRRWSEAEANRTWPPDF
ncbi:MAG: thioesterase family protein [Pseudomonadota bacterium]